MIPVSVDSSTFGHVKTTFATSVFRERNEISVNFRAKCGAIEVINDTILVPDVTDLEPDEYLDAVSEWLLTKLVTEITNEGEDDGDN